MANLDNSNNPMTTLGMFSTKKTRTMVPTILTSCRSRLLERETLGLEIVEEGILSIFKIIFVYLKNIMKLRMVNKMRGARPVVVRGWRD